MDNTIKDLLSPIIGEYVIGEYLIEKEVTEFVVLRDDLGTETVQPVTYQVSETVTAPDYVWFLSAVVFVVLLYSVFRALGGLLKCRI